LGVTLFERGSDISVTDIGRQVVEQAQVVLEQAAVVKRIAGERQNELVGPLKLGIIFTIGPYLLPKLIPALRHVAPDMPLYLEENYTSRLADMLKSGEIDAAIVAEPFDEPNIVTLPLYDEPFVIATPKDHPWADRDAIQPHELA
ncbi:MAG: LysR substrate-binding domain-containing protein, partial [Microvirgula sp.]